MGTWTTQVGAERIRVPLGRDWRKDLLRARTSLLIPPYSGSDSTVVGEEVPVEGEERRGEIGVWMERTRFPMEEVWGQAVGIEAQEAQSAQDSGCIPPWS